MAYFHLMLSQSWCCSMMCFPNNFFTSSGSWYFTACNKPHALSENFNIQSIHCPSANTVLSGSSFPHGHKLKSILSVHPKPLYLCFFCPSLLSVLLKLILCGVSVLKGKTSSWQLSVAGGSTANWCKNDIIYLTDFSEQR